MHSQIILEGGAQILIVSDIDSIENTSKISNHEKSKSVAAKVVRDSNSEKKITKKFKNTLVAASHSKFNAKKIKNTRPTTHFNASNSQHCNYILPSTTKISKIIVIRNEFIVYTADYIQGFVNKILDPHWKLIHIDTSPIRPPPSKILAI